MKRKFAEKVAKAEEYIQDIRIAGGERDVTIVTIKTDLGLFRGVAVKNPEEKGKILTGYQVALGRAIKAYETEKELRLLREYLG